jgi:hypothetical protein
MKSITTNTPKKEAANGSDWDVFWGYYYFIQDPPG